MKNIDTKNLEQLVEQKKWQEAKKIMEDVFNSAELSEEEKGEIHTKLASVYMQVVNNINRRYEASLDEMISTLKKIDAKESEVNDKIDLAEVRSEIKGGE